MHKQSFNKVPPSSHGCFNYLTQGCFKIVVLLVPVANASEMESRLKINLASVKWSGIGLSLAVSGLLIPLR